MKFLIGALIGIVLGALALITGIGGFIAGIAAAGGFSEDTPDNVEEKVEEVTIT